LLGPGIKPQPPCRYRRARGPHLCATPAKWGLRRNSSGSGPDETATMALGPPSSSPGPAIPRGSIRSAACYRRLLTETGSRVAARWVAAARCGPLVRALHPGLNLACHRRGRSRPPRPSAAIPIRRSGGPPKTEWPCRPAEGRHGAVSVARRDWVFADQRRRKLGGPARSAGTGPRAPLGGSRGDRAFDFGGPLPPPDRTKKTNTPRGPVRRSAPGPRQTACRPVVGRSASEGGGGCSEQARAYASAQQYKEAGPAVR